MTKIYKSGKWQAILRVGEALARAGFATSTDFHGVGGQYSIAVDMREVVAARRIVAEMIAHDAPGLWHGSL